jgi:hypothetical protein
MVSFSGYDDVIKRVTITGRSMFSGTGILSSKAKEKPFLMSLRGLTLNFLEQFLNRVAGVFQRNLILLHT